MSNNVSKPTRGNGLLEPLLANLRVRKAKELISSNIENNRILDLGCGSYPHFLMEIDFKEKYGIDPTTDVNLVDGENLKVLKLDITKNKLPYSSNYFNAVTMLAVFEHIDIDKINFVLKEVFRVLKKDGVFVLTTPSPWADKLLHNMAKLSLISSEEIHEHKSHYRMKDISSQIAAAGFDKDKIQNGYFELGFNMWFKIGK